MRRPGYLIAAAVLAPIAVTFWYLVLSDGWIGRTGFGREVEAVEDGDD